VTRWQWSSMVILPLVLFGLMTAVLSCSPAETGPRAWIDWPRDGYETTVGTTVTLIAHAYAEDGVAELQLAVDRQPYRVVTPDQAGQQFVEVSSEWMADEPGTYLLSMTAFDVNGEAGNLAYVTVSVTGEEPSPTTPSEIPTATPTATGAPTGTPTSTGVPTNTATSTGISTNTPAVTGTATATTPRERVRIVSFEVDSREIILGECVRFSWRVEGQPTAIYFDGEGVTSPDSGDRCPTTTRDFELRVEGYGGPVTESITVVVRQPSPTATPDTQGPAAPGGLNPGGGEVQGCGAVTLRWNPVSDPGGIKTYYVKVEKVSGTYESGAWTTVDTELTIPAAWLECGHEYRWAVRAEDGVGNVGPWSAWAEFSVTIG
jgi:hypothetical protein